MPSADSEARQLMNTRDSGGVELIRAERTRQMEVEGWTPEHDDEHTFGEMVSAAACYLEAKPFQFQRNIRRWPWDARRWKPKDRVSNLVRAGALIAAEIDRLQRASILAKHRSALGTREASAQTAGQSPHVEAK